MLNSIPKVLDPKRNHQDLGNLPNAISELYRIRIQSKFGPFHAAI